MKIVLATDHAGFNLKEEVKQHLKSYGHQIEDVGALEFNAEDDYTDFMYKAAQLVAQDPGNTRGIIFGGSGQGEAMQANRVKGVRATVYYAPNLDIIDLSREHNNANVLSIAARFVPTEQALEAIDRWLAAPFPGEERHVRRIKNIDALT